MDVHNRVMCLLVWLVQEVERKVGWENYGSPLMVSSLSRSYRPSERASVRADLEIGKSRRSGGVVVVNANLSKPRGGQGYAVRCACVAAARRHEIGVYCTGWSIRMSTSRMQLISRTLSSGHPIVEGEGEERVHEAVLPSPRLFRGVSRLMAPFFLRLNGIVGVPPIERCSIARSLKVPISLSDSSSLHSLLRTSR